VTLDEGLAHAMSERALALKKPVEWISFSRVAGFGACPVLGLSVALKERARHGIHALVGALRGKNGGGRAARGIAEAELDAREWDRPGPAGSSIFAARVFRSALR